MKISKSKQELAHIISENGGWCAGANWMSQDRDGGIYSFLGARPVRHKDMWCLKPSSEKIGWRFAHAGTIPNWHQTILSREEYFHLYQAPDADGWIEWSGGECPVERGAIVDVKYANNTINYGVSALTNRAHEGHVCGTVGSMTATNWDADLSMSGIIAYRLHNPEQAKPEFCESVMRTIPEPEAKPTIEQLAGDYRNKLAIATQAQEEADSHRCGAEVALSKLEIAAKELGFKIEPITAKQEQEPTITDWRDLRVGDVIWVGGTIVTVDEPEGECEIIGENIYSYASGLRMFLQPFLVRRGDVEFRPDLKCRGWRFIRRP